MILEYSTKRSTITKMDVLQDIRCKLSKNSEHIPMKSLKEIIKLELALEFMRRTHQCIEGDIKSFVTTMDEFNDRLNIVEKKTSGDDIIYATAQLNNKFEWMVDDKVEEVKSALDAHENKLEHDIVYILGKIEEEVDNMQTKLMEFVTESNGYKSDITDMFGGIMFRINKQESINTDTQESILSIVSSIDRLERENADLRASLAQQQTVIDSLVVRLDALESKDDWESLT